MTNKKTFKKAATIVLITLILIAFLLIFWTLRHGKVEKLEDQIAIPCYGTMTMKAGVLEQGFKLSNPKENTCWFAITITLEDGTVIWRSELIEPGHSSDEVVLFTPLEAGSYKNVTIHYACYRVLDELVPLNNGQEQLTINVH